MAAAAPYIASGSTTGATSATLSFPLTSGYGALIIEVAALDQSGNFTCSALNVGFKNMAGTVTVYAKSLSNMLGSPLCDTALALCSATVAGGTNGGSVTVTGVAGATISWTVFVTVKNVNP